MPLFKIKKKRERGEETEGLPDFCFIFMLKLLRSMKGVFSRIFLKKYRKTLRKLKEIIRYHGRVTEEMQSEKQKTIVFTCVFGQNRFGIETEELISCLIPFVAKETRVCIYPL